MTGFDFTGVEMGQGARLIRVEDTPEKDSGANRILLAAELTARSMEDAAGSLVMLHAAGISDCDGRVVALVGHSSAGKTKAAVELCTSEFGYVTDETVAVDETGRVLSFPRPLEWYDNERGLKFLRSPDELGLRPCGSSLVLGRVVLLDRSDSPRAEPELTAIDIFDAIAEVIPHTSFLAALPAPLLRLAELVRGSGVFRLRYTEILDAARIIAENLLTPLTEVSLGPLLHLGSGAHLPLDWALMDARVRRRPFQDAIRIGDEALVLVGSTSVRLAGIGLTIWLEAQESPPFDELVRKVVLQHGSHPDARSLVLAAVEAMSEAKVIGFARPQPFAQALGGIRIERSSRLGDRAVAEVVSR